MSQSPQESFCPAPASLPDSADGDPGFAQVLSFIESQHPELFHLLHAPAAQETGLIELVALPVPTQQWVWRLYVRHYPPFAQWLRVLNMDAWRERFDAKLELRVRDILSAARAELTAPGPR